MLLRAVLGITLEVQGVDSLMNWHDLTLITQAIGLLAIASGALLLIGFFTPFASVLGGLICVASKLLWLQRLPSTCSRQNSLPHLRCLLLSRSFVWAQERFQSMPDCLGDGRSLSPMLRIPETLDREILRPNSRFMS